MRLCHRLTVVAAIAISFWGAAASAQTVLDTVDYKVRVTKVVEGLNHPWGMAFLPDGRMLITERRGQMRIVDGGKLIAASVEGLPTATEHGQGGLLDVALHPKYAENGWVYWSYNGAEKGQHGTELARGKLAGTKEQPRMTDVQVLFKLQPKSSAGQHFGSRIVFDKQGLLYLTLGDRGDSSSKGAEQRAQKLDDHAGKSIRLTDDGKVPPDNPFVKTQGAKPEIFTYGNRNIQGAALHPGTGKLWAHEHGPQGGDEVNILEAGKNYGWPIITYGANYGIGTKIGEGTSKDGLVPPLWHWVPSIAPSGMVFYSGRNFPKWKGDLFVGALAKQKLVRLTLDGDKITKQEDLFDGKLGRIRDVREGPDGNLYLLTDSSKGELIRLEPVK